MRDRAKSTLRRGTLTPTSPETDNTENPAEGLPIATEAGVSVAFANLPAGCTVSQTATAILLDSTHAWAKPTWIANGSPTYPTKAQIEAELEASALVEVALPVVFAGGVATVALPALEPYAVVMIRVEYALGA